MVKNKKFLFIVAFLVFSLLLVACGNGDDTEVATDDAGTEVAGGDTDATDTDGPSAGGGGIGASGESDEVIVAIGGEIPTLDPHGANMQAASQVNIHVLETLVNQDDNLEIYPNLATSWEQIDEQTWRFYLREDVYFHNGDHMTASDVAFSITRAAEAPMVAPVMGMIDTDSIEIIDDYTIVIGTNYPFAPLLSHLTHRAGSILSADAMGDVPGGPDTDFELIVGTGPYQVAENIAGDRIVMERWDDWHGELPNMRRITYRITPDAAARTFAIETGDVDIIMNPAPADIARLEAEPNVNVPQTPSLQTEYVAFNTERVDDVLVRQAINYALDIPMIVDVITEGVSVPAIGYVVEMAFGHNPDFEPVPFNMERARELMIEAGHSGEEGANDLTIEIMANTENNARMQSAEIIANQLDQIGINIDIVTMEFNTMNEDFIQQGLHDMATLGWTTVTGDADYALFPLFHSESSTNHSNFNNAEFDDLIERARASSDPAERQELYNEAQEILREESPWILMSTGTVRLPAQTNVGGIVVMPHQSHFFGNIYFTD